MKKILFFFITAIALTSCSSESDTVVPPTTLQKVVFYSNTPNERQWNISDDLLRNITLADGTVVEEFIYDSHNRLVSDIKYTGGLVSETTTITYNADNTIQSINGLPYAYNSSTRTYTYSYGSSFTISCQVNSDFLVENFVRTGTDAGEYHMAYSSGDMTSFEKINSGSTEIIKNFHFDGLYGANPLYNAVLAVARVKSLTDPNFFIDGVASTSIAGGYDRGASDNHYYSYGYSSSTSNNPTHNDKDFSIGIEVLDNSMNTVGVYSFADYIYQF
ncbi:membrane lipoprotein lipid attachment site-containing protein [Flavobacterium sp. AS60]|uniref:membrane lipoprotein lipid attachment site-containing protein n=1 Tax=Flavobacterium anseongense TaxID=2910677 RepID=UPI001F3C8586|nr:membrane lipoprotein lipid attachment site-containing protein [Flavobacterium sp. AS60]MCF6128296.1 membrane lipoprotein lipid attachment site-containing protein [Flavobacterium sp. AS60]